MLEVSVILPTYNRLRFLRAAIASVHAQTLANWELIIADDGSDEETREFLASVAGPRVRTLWLSHCGNPARVRNCAIQEARGRYLAFLDSDDVWAASKLEKQIAALRARPQCRWSYTACGRLDEEGRHLANARPQAPMPREGWILEPLLRLQVAIAMPTVVAERSLVQEIGGFDEQQYFGEFHDLCLRLAMRSEVVGLAESLCDVRAHDEHYSSDRTAADASWMRLYGKMADTIRTPRLRSFCRRMRAQKALQLARRHSDSGRYRESCSTLLRAARFSWRYPGWWYHALAGLARPIVPDVVAAALRRRRDLLRSSWRRG